MNFRDLPLSTHPLYVVRPIAAADIPVWFDYLSRPVVYEHTSWHVQSPSELAPLVWTPSMGDPDHSIRFALALRSTDQLIGTIGFHTVSSRHRTAEIGYDLSPSHWGHGIATDACTLLTSWGHRDAALVRVQAAVLESNARSTRVLERCGFTREGLLRNYRLVEGVPSHFWMYSHLP